MSTASAAYTIGNKRYARGNCFQAKNEEAMKIYQRKEPNRVKPVILAWGGTPRELQATVKRTDRTEVTKKGGGGGR